MTPTLMPRVRAPILQRNAEANPAPTSPSIKGEIIYRNYLSHTSQIYVNFMKALCQQLCILVAI